MVDSPIVSPRSSPPPMFCLLPGLNESTGNLCGLAWIPFCWLAMVGLKDLSVPYLD